MLKSVVADLDSVDESLRAFYVERGGKHYLAVEAVDGYALEDVSGLKSALASERRKVADGEAARQAVEADLARYGGMDPVRAQEALNRINSGAAGADVERLVAERAENMRASIAETAGAEARTARAELDTVRGTLTKRESQLQRLALDHVLRSELTKVKPLEDAADALMLMAAQHVKMVEVDGELVARVVDRKGEPRLDTKGEPVTIGAFMGEMREQRKALFQPTRNTEGLGTSPQRGRPAGSGSEPNPFHPATRNLTQQAILSKRDPAKAARLKAEAGVY